MQITWQQMTLRVFQSDLVLVEDGDGHKIASVFLNGESIAFCVKDKTFNCNFQYNQNIVAVNDMIYLMDHDTKKEFIITLFKSYNI